MGWLALLDPNVVMILVSLLGMSGTWLYHKIKGDKATSVSDLIDSILANISHELLSEYSGQDLASYLSDARDKFENLIWQILAKRGVQKTEILEPVVHLAVEKAS